MSVISAFSRVKSAMRKVEKTLFAQDKRTLLRQAEDGRQRSNKKVLAKLFPIVRRFLLQNLRKAGITSRTGKLEEAVSQASVWIKGQGTGRVRVYIGWKADIPGSKTAKKASEKSVYVYGSALNYGAVYAKDDKARVFNERKKRRLKAMVYARVTPGPLTPQKARVAKMNVARIGKSYVAGKNLRITPARHFFRLTPAQEWYIQNRYSTFVAQAKTQEQAGEKAQTA